MRPGNAPLQAVPNSFGGQGFDVAGERIVRLVAVHVHPQTAVGSDAAERGEMLRQAEEIAMSETAAFPIYYYVSKNVVSPAISGFEDNAKDIHRTRWLSKSE